MRLVSLCPSITETLFELGAGDSVVGATKFCEEPAGRLGHVERIGGTKNPSIERVAELAPDLVFMNEEENRREDYRALRDRGIEVHTSFPKGPRDVPPMLRSFGEAVGAVREAEGLAADVEAAIEELPKPRDASPAFLVLVWRKPWIGVGEDTFTSRLLEAAGGRNALHGGAWGDRYPALGESELKDLSPNAVLLPSEPFPFGKPHCTELASHVRIEESRFILCDGRALTWHGARTALALRRATEWFAGTRPFSSGSSP